MIVRILGEGQFDITDETLSELNQLDDQVQAAVEAGDHDLFAQALAALVTGVRTAGKELADDYLGPSDLVIPGPDSTLEEVRELLVDNEEGLIPG
jgi:hypothetical protein